MDPAVEPRKATHLFYHMVKYASSPSSHPPNIPLFYIFQLSIALYAAYRLSLVSYLSQLPSPPLWYPPYDAFAYAWTHPTAPLDVKLLLIVLMLEIFVLYDHLLIYRQSATSYSIAWFKEAVVHFGDKAQSARRSQTKRNRLYQDSIDEWDASLAEKLPKNFPVFAVRRLQRCARPIGRLWVRFQLWHSLAYFNRRKLARQSLSVQPNLSGAIRRHLLLSLQAVEWAGLAAQTVVCLTVSQFFLGTYLRFRDGLTWTAFPFIPFDLLAVYYQLYQLINLALFFTICTLISVLVNMRHCGDICGQLQVVLRKKQRMRGNCKLPRAFSLFLVDYYRCIGLATYGNGGLFSGVLFAFLLTNVPINIYFIVQIGFNSGNTSMLILSSVGCLFQACSFYAVLGPLAFFCAAMHRPIKILPALQLQLGPEPTCLGLKLKLDNLLFRLLHHRPVAISVGPLSAVTHRLILEFLTMYGGYLLIAFSMQMKGKFD